jgi:tetratricopeptide (TPR) repeat protein
LSPEDPQRCFVLGIWGQGGVGKTSLLKRYQQIAKYDRALVYQALGQIEQAKSDFDQAIQRAQRKYDEKPEDWNNGFNLALYHLAAGHFDQAKHFYGDALRRGVPASNIRAAIRDLEYFLKVFPDREDVRRVLQGLQRRLSSEE